ncbi:PHP domain-containing protein [Phosphitispora fastidiosa]|uniref:PHP domain-containing protein n=1 Tax=Phosphitispora fastidiosa TaxID=2837202 RepID=UPI001E4B469A|nr:PHP domain-containing protein [Phosphitispora fastidiosa]MBU7006474.1 putative metal-dependent phosphoesterase TrpH [Phosphitispora fastidiosa]
MDSDFIDLHVHTTASDGTMTPERIVFLAARCGLKAVAITDHDTVEGLAEALQAGEKAGIEVVPGVEIGVDYPGEMHILGYYMDHRSSRLSRDLAQLRESRDRRNPRMAAKLRELGFDITMDEVARAAGGTVVGRPHFAAVLKKKGYINSVEEAFDRYLGAGRPAYVKKDKISPAQGIEMITGAGGIPVLAHPHYLRAGGREEFEELLRALCGSGLMGIEAYYSTHSATETAYFCALAKTNGLLVTGGSDFHGANKPEIKLGRGLGGLAVGYNLLAKMKEVKKTRDAGGTRTVS